MQSMMARQEGTREVITCIGDVMLDRVRPAACTFFGTDSSVALFVVVVVVVIVMHELLSLVGWSFTIMG